MSSIILLVIHVIAVVVSVLFAALLTEETDEFALEYSEGLQALYRIALDQPLGSGPDLSHFADDRRQLHEDMRDEFGPYVGLRTDSGEELGYFRASVFDLDTGWHELSYDELYRDEFETELALDEDEALDRSFQFKVFIVQTDEARFVTSTEIYPYNFFTDEFAQIIVLFGWLTAGIVFASGIFFGFRYQRRLRHLEDGLTKVAAGDLSIRLAPEERRDSIDIVAERIDQTTIKLEALFAQLNNMSRGIAHDLKTPLARLRAGLEAEALGTLGGGMSVEDAIVEEENIIAIFDSISRISLIEAGAGRERFERVRLGDLAKSFSDKIAAVVEDSGREFRVDIGETEVIDGDPRMLEQALANLIQNALRYATPKSPIILSAKGRSISLSNEGEGIAVEDRERVLRPMVRLDAARTTEGSGLGLAMVRAIVEMHGGKIVFEHKTPEPPHGIVVTLAF